MADPYRDNVNPELLAMMPITARSVLEIGCGSGALGAAYKQRNPMAHYTGVEHDTAAATRAETCLDRVLNADADTLGSEDLGGPFDLIVMGDTLEHLADPHAVLRLCTGLLAPDGTLALSVPNIAHWSALRELMMGRWPEADSGLFDRTHRSFWTQSRLIEALSAAGLVWRKQAPRNVSLNKAEQDRWLPVLAAAAEQMGQPRAAFEARAQALQYVVVAQRADQPPSPMLELRTVTAPTDLLAARSRAPSEAMRSLPRVTASVQASLPLRPQPGAQSVAVFYRPGARAATDMIAVLARAMAAGWTCVLDFDDSPDLVAEKVQGFDAAVFRRYAPAFHAIQTSTPALVEEFSALHPEVRLVPNAVLEAAPAQDLPEGAPAQVFFGALNRESISGVVAAGLRRVIAAHPETHFHVVHDKVFFDALPTEAKTLHPLLDHAAYRRLMAQCQIALMPLAGTTGEDRKSDLKFLEAASLGVAAIVSPLVYGATVTHGRTAMVAAEVDQWPVMLDHLLRNPKRRARIAAAAQALVTGADGGGGRMFCHDAAAREGWYRDLVARRSLLTAAAAARVPDLAAALKALKTQEAS